MNIGSFITGTMITVLLLLVGHWFPWVTRLTRLQAYVYGLASVLIGLTIWKGTVGDWITVAGLWILSLIAGCSVVGAYKLDELIVAARKGHKAEAADARLAQRPLADD